MQFLACFLCGRKLEKRTTKNFKPYFVCDPCGMQLFVRGKDGIKRLDLLFRNIEEAKIPFTRRQQDLHEMQAILEEIEGVKQEIDKLGFYFFDDEKKRAHESLKTKLENLLHALQEIAERSSLHS